MNQVISKILKNNINYKYIIISIIFSIIIFIYIPLFIGELDIRNKQISRGFNNTSSLPVFGSDSEEYITLALNLFNHNIFSVDYKPPFNKDTFRTIGYPLFITILMYLGITIKFIPIIQIIIAGIISYFIYLIASQFFNEKIGLLSSILFLIDPLTISNSLIIVSDILYVLFLVISIYLFFNKKNNLFNLILGSIFLGISTLIRPISMFLLFLIFIIYLYRQYKNKIPINTIIFNMLWIFIVYLSVVMPWIIRNRNITGVYGISTIKSYNIYHYYVPEYLSYKNHISTENARNIISYGLNSFDERSLSNASMMQKRAMSFIWKDPFGYGVFHIIKTLPFFLSSSIESFFSIYNFSIGEDVFKVNNTNMTGLLMSFNIKGFIYELKNNLIITFEQIILSIFLILCIIAIFKGYKHRSLKKVLLLWSIIVYFAILTGPVSYSRYRLPASPFIFILIAYVIKNENLNLHTKSR